ncbi:MAG: DUF2061 domain-containing protein [Gammaproteobacteria bacterium]
MRSSVQKPPSTSDLLSLAKAFSWRIVATLTTALIAYAITGEIDTALWIGGIEFFLKIGIYYTHERLWLWLT